MLSSFIVRAADFIDPTGEQPAQIKDLEAVFSNLVNTLLGFGAIILFVMLIVGGFRYLTAGGDPKAVEAARGTLSSAITGIVIVVLAFLILQFIQNFTGANVTEFRVTP